MTQQLQPALADGDRFPVSHPQRVWCGLAEAGAFGPRFIVARGFRVTGRVDVAALQAALDDVVARHELLRTIVVHDAEPPYQRVYLPSPVPLEVRDLPPDAERTRDHIAEDLLTEAEAGSLDVLELPLLRAVLARFDDEDAVFTLTTHHMACDGWSLQLILRDLSTYYAARVSRRTPVLPPVLQYREFAIWQQQYLAGPEAAKSLEYWNATLAGGQIFALPNDRPVPAKRSQPYAEHDFTIEPEVIAELVGYAKRIRCSMFMVILATFNVFVHRLLGTIDPMIETIIHGRGHPEFANTVGPLMNQLPLRTSLADCVTVTDVARATRRSCLDGFSHELPIQYIAEAIPHIGDPLEDPHNSEFTLGLFEAPFGHGALKLADRTTEIHKPARKTPQNPGGVVLSLSTRSAGELFGCLEYSPEEFDADTVALWMTDYSGLIRRVVAGADRDWRRL
jgi:condensation enzyme